MQIKIFIIDAFTNQAFKGNPAGVCLLEENIAEETMQAIAGEINLSETAFLKQDPENDTRYTIRYYTPTVEIAFCGHATLAASKLVLHRFKKATVQFTTHHNLIISAIAADEEIKMNFPLYATVAYDPAPAVYKALGIANPINAGFAKELNMLIIEVDHKNTLKEIKPDFVLLLKAVTAINVVIVTTKSNDAEYDFYSRCFCPWIGINEDPVTGAAHTVLAKYWGDRLGKSEMVAYQLSKRGGFMKLKINKDKMEVDVTSEATIVVEGILNC